MFALACLAAPPFGTIPQAHLLFMGLNAGVFMKLLCTRNGLHLQIKYSNRKLITIDPLKRGGGGQRLRQHLKYVAVKNICTPSPPPPPHRGFLVCTHTTLEFPLTLCGGDPLCTMRSIYTVPSFLLIHYYCLLFYQKVFQQCNKPTSWIMIYHQKRDQSLKTRHQNSHVGLNTFLPLCF